MTLAFDGVRVLELGQIYNGPYCGLLLAQLGADVIKVEPPGGEPLRFRSHLPVETHEFVMLNSNKRSVVLDLKTEDGREALLDLVDTADVLIENFAPGTMDRLQLAPGAAPRAQPASDRRVGQGLRVHGPVRADVGDGHHRAGDVGRARRSPAMPTGHRRSRAPRSSTSPAASTCSARSAPRCSSASAPGRGQVVEVSMHDTIYPMLASSLGGLHNDPERELPERTGNRHSGMAVAPYNIYPASDGWLAIICISERHWRGVATGLGRPELDRRPPVPHREGQGRQHRRGRRRGVRPAPGPAHAPSCSPTCRPPASRARRSSPSVRSTPTST